MIIYLNLLKLHIYLFNYLFMHLSTYLLIHSFTFKCKKFNIENPNSNMMEKHFNNENKISTARERTNYQSRIKFDSL